MRGRLRAFSTSTVTSRMSLRMAYRRVLFRSKVDEFVPNEQHINLRITCEAEGVHARQVASLLDQHCHLPDALHLIIIIIITSPDITLTWNVKPERVR